MAGIYFHIPFCRQLCYYCDFHFSLSLRDKDLMIAAMLQEMTLRKDYLSKENVTTLYFGGGTSSVLTLVDVERILDKAQALFPISAKAEISLEANPDDLSAEYLSGLRALGINRLSIGVQSFHDHELKRMNRRHNATEAMDSVKKVLRCGFEDITIDLMYGFPDSTLDSWRYSLETALAFHLPHLSCYHLNFEERTAFAHFKRKGKLRPLPEKISWAQYQLLCEAMASRGYRHYEISNFAKAGWQSRHNNAYWEGIPYLGIGPAAHSFDGKTRQWNIAHNLKYRKGVARGEGFHEQENLSEKEQFHDYLLTRFRTAKGIELSYLQNHFTDLYSAFYRQFRHYIYTDLVKKTGNGYCLTEKGMFQSDGIIGDLFVLD